MHKWTEPTFQPLIGKRVICIPIVDVRKMGQIYKVTAAPITISRACEGCRITGMLPTCFFGSVMHKGMAVGEVLAYATEIELLTKSSKRMIQLRKYQTIAIQAAYKLVAWLLLPVWWNAGLKTRTTICCRQLLMHKVYCSLPS